MALQTFRDLFAGYPTSNESDNAVEFVRNIFIEDQTPELFVQFMNDFGKSLSTNEQDSLVYRSADRYTKESCSLVDNDLPKSFIN